MLYPPCGEFVSCLFFFVFLKVSKRFPAQWETCCNKNINTEYLLHTSRKQTLFFSDVNHEMDCRTAVQPVSVPWLSREDFCISSQPFFFNSSTGTEETVCPAHSFFFFVFFFFFLRDSLFFFLKFLFTPPDLSCMFDYLFL